MPRNSVAHHGLVKVLNGSFWHLSEGKILWREPGSEPAIGKGAEIDLTTGAQLTQGWARKERMPDYLPAFRVPEENL